MLLHYLHTYKKSKINNFSSEIILYFDSDASYLVAPKTNSRTAKYFYCCNKNNHLIRSLPVHSPVHVECTLLQHVVMSVRAEVATAGLFYHYQTAIDIQNMFTILGYPQPTSPVKIDNTTAAQLSTTQIKQM